MEEAQALQYILDRARVTPQQVVVAKAMILKGSEGETRASALIDAVLRGNGVAMPQQVVLHDSAAPESALKAAAEALSWRMAAAEALWSLIHADYLMPATAPERDNLTLRYTTVPPGGGSGYSGGWPLEEILVPVPAKLRRAPSLSTRENLFLSDADLYLATLAVPAMHPEVEAALREAVECFRHELFTAAVAMLGKASEGAWLELGASLLDSVPEDRRPSVAKQRAVLESPTEGTMRKIEAVLTVFDRQDIFRPLAEASKIRPPELRSAMLWSNAVRDSRNTIHFGVTPDVPNTYEKLATLLICAPRHLRALYRLKDVAESAPPPPVA